jgi:uncharacterized phage infection (PIP) family protein YhgE
MRQRSLGAPRTWLMPILLIIGLAGALPAVYLAGTVDPQGHLRDMPVGLVVESQTRTAGPDFAESVAQALETGAGSALAFARMSDGELATAIAEDRVAGAVVIPEDFDASIASLLPGATESMVPTITIVTNAGDGGLSTGLLMGVLAPVFSGIEHDLGSRLLESTSGQMHLA